METLSPEIVEDLRHGRATRERKIAVCTGGAHLAPADRAEILSVLASDADEVVAQRAEDALISFPWEGFLEAVKRETAPPALFAYVAKNLADKPGICDAMVQNKKCGAEHLVQLVRHFSTAAMQSLMEDHPHQRVACARKRPFAQQRSYGRTEKPASRASRLRH